MNNLVDLGETPRQPGGGGGGRRQMSIQETSDPREALPHES